MPGMAWTHSWTSPWGGQSRINARCEQDTAQWSLRVSYTLWDRWHETSRDLDYPIALRSESCRFGGCRWYLGCPKCQHRRRALYLGSGCATFACRECLGLTYESRRSWDKRVSAFVADESALVRALDGSYGDLHLLLRTCLGR